MGKKGGLYENWLKTFTINIMTQSFHAFFLMFVMKMLSEFGNIGADEGGLFVGGEFNAGALVDTDGLVAIMSIVGMMSIIKFEKLFKKLFGLEDSISGDLKGAGAKMFMGLQAANSLQSEIREPFKKSSESKRRMASLGKEAGLTKTGYVKGKDGKDVFVGKIGNYAKPSSGGTVASTSTNKPELSDKTKDIYQKMKDAKKDGNMDLYRDYRDHAVTQMKYEKASTAGGTSGAGGTTYGTGGVRTVSGGTAATTTPVKTKAEKIQEYNDAVLENRQNDRKKWVKTAGTLTSLAMGFGATDETSEALKIADIVNDPINKASGKYIDDGERRTATKATGDTKYMERALSTAIRQGFQDATRSSRNENGKINPGKLTIEVAKSYVTTPIRTMDKAARRTKIDNVGDI